MKIRNLKRNVSRVAITASLAAGLIALPAFAQEGSDDEAPTADSTRTLQTVTVTSQKREENILDVPVAVSAISAEQLQISGVQNFRDLTRVSPSLTINENNTQNSSSISLRGIGTYAFSTGVEPSVSVVIDDVANARQLQAFSNLSDIERVEVLRGPQGTLFGKNASAGVISVVTKAPSDVLTGYAEATLTDDDEYRLNGSLSGPLGETAGFRLNAYYADREGHIDNLALGTQVNGDDGFGVRGKLQWDPSADLAITLIGDYSERNTDGTAFTYFDVPANALFLGAVPFAAVSAGLTPGEDNFSTRLSEDPTGEATALSLTGRVVYNFGNFELTSITNYQESDYEFFADVDGTDFDLLGVFTMGAFSGGLTQGGPFSTEQITQEFRLSSTLGDNFEYLVGLFYADSETDRAFSRGPLLFAADWFGSSGSESLAAFGQATLNLSDTTRLTGGLRIGQEEIDVVYNEVTPAATFMGDADDSYVTGKIALQHDITPNTMVFGSVSTGYKGQGFDLTTGFTQDNIDNLVGSEDSLSFEIGAKGRAMNDRVEFSVVAFSTEYTDFQAQSAVADPSGTLQLSLENVGELKTQGIELDVAAQLTNSLRVDVGAALVDATIESFAGAQCYPGQTVAEGCVGGVQDLAGSSLSNAPDFKFNVGAVYEHEMPSIGFDAILAANYQWQDDVNFDLFANPRTVQDSYGIANFRLGLVESNNRNFEVALFVNNAFDQVYAAQLIDFSALYGGSPVIGQSLPRNARRHAGISLKAGF